MHLKEWLLPVEKKKITTTETEVSPNERRATELEVKVDNREEREKVKKEAMTVRGGDMIEIILVFSELQKSSSSPDSRAIA